MPWTITASVMFYASTYLLTPLHVIFCFHHPSFFSCIAHARAGPTNMNFRRPASRAGHARTCTIGCYGVVQCLPVKSPRSTVGIYGERRTIAWCLCTPPSIMETFGEKICVEACSGKEIAGSLKKMTTTTTTTILAWQTGGRYERARHMYS